MSEFKFGKRSLDNLKGVNENLVKVVKRALELSAVDFTIVEGVRTIERQKELVKQGVSKTMNSYHIRGKAVDLYPYYNGKVQVEAPSNKWGKIANAMKEAAKELNVQVTWGGDWKSVDRPHFQIEEK